jgi:hypothetical protein
MTLLGEAVARLIPEAQSELGRGQSTAEPPGSMPPLAEEAKQPANAAREGRWM